MLLKAGGRRTFKLIRKELQHRLSDDMQSSIAAAFEHFTAIISSVLLEHAELFDETHPELRAMLYWHFVEETEHKSVSFDVFVDASGGGLEGSQPGEWREIARPTSDLRLRRAGLTQAA
ncbi:MAG: metal-dependent hydrolase [Erythrobacter sp.]|nr:metal-dependent hydrolase [Erythrobacter sp.]MDZ4300056.1 metal-dependent hydrolase [Pseudomonas sp.]